MFSPPPDTVLVRIDDKHRTPGAIPVGPKECVRWNQDGWGIFFTPNGFRKAAHEEHQANGTKTDRNERYLQKIHYVYGDLDVAKSGDGESQEEINRRKGVLQEALCEKFPPSVLIETRNGWQPLWRVERDPTDEQKRLAVSVMNGVIVWSKLHGGFGDPVKDLARVLRLPGYYHNKADPFLCTATVNSDDVISIDSLAEAFPFTMPEPYQPGENAEDPFPDQTIQEILGKAFHQIGRSVEFDSQGRLILDGRLSGNFIGRQGSRDYLATTSGKEPYKGNKVTATASVLGCTPAEAVKWIRQAFNIPVIRPVPVPDSAFEAISDSMQESMDYLHKIDPPTVLKYGYREMDDHLGGIYEGEIVLIGGETGTGKSTFAMNVLRNNTARAKVAYFALEETKREHNLKAMYFLLGKLRRQKSKKNYPWAAFRNNEIFSEEYREEYADAMRIFRTDQILLYRKPKDEQLDAQKLLALLAKARERGIRLACVDHLHFFDHGDSDESTALKIESTMKFLKQAAETNDLALLVIAHYRKLNGRMPTLDSFKDSSAICQNASVVINLWRDRSEGAPDANTTKVLIPKNRSPSGEATFEMIYDPGTSEMRFSSVAFGTKQELTREQEIALLKKKTSLPPSTPPI